MSGWLTRLFARGERPLRINVTHDSDAEERTRDELLALIERYDLARWRFTSRVRIDERARIPHSHPVLTLNTHYDGNLLLAAYLHEQLHWFVVRHWNRERRARQELRRRYPETPVDLPEGAGSERSSYLHYIVCYLEYAALIDVLGPEEARRVIEYWAAHHYTAIYRAVLDDNDAIGELVARYGLMPPQAR
jgi:hypothetical protein